MKAIAMSYNNDSEIIKDYVSSGSQKAATAFVRKHQAFVFATAMRYLGNTADADDAAQEVFIKALENLKKFRADSSVTTWLYRITANHCQNLLRKKKWTKLFSSKPADEHFDIADNDPNPNLQLENEEFNMKFEKMLNELPEKQRETFALRYFEEMPYNDISNMLGTSVGGLKANYYQAVKKLSALIKESDYFDKT